MKETPQGVYFGNLFGFPLFAHRTLVAVAPMLAFMVFAAGSTGDLLDRIFLLVFLLASVFLHELAHAFAARASGVPVKHIALTWFGGYAEFWLPPTCRRDEIVIALAGPFANLALGGLALLLLALLFETDAVSWAEGGAIYIRAAEDPTLVERALRSLGWTNIALGLFNLLPGLPLDGGHVLRSVLSTVISSRRAHRIALFLGFLIGLGVVAYAFRVESLWTLLIGVFIVASAWDGRAQLT